MNKKLFSILVFSVYTLFFSTQVNAQGWAWAKSAGGANYDEATTTATDIRGNVYVAGYFNSPTVTFGTTTLNNVSGYDAFLVKYDSTGNVLWANSFGGYYDDYATALATDFWGNVYVAGYFTSTSINLGITTLSNTGAPGTSDLFLVKFDSAGTVKWARTSQGTNDEAAYSIKADAAGNIYVTGMFNSLTMTVGSSVLTNVSAGSSDVFLAKYNGSGGLLWATSAGGSDNDCAKSLTIDNWGNVFISGYYMSATLSFGSVSLSDVLAGSSDIFTAKYNSSGSIIWARSAGGRGSDEAYGVATDAKGDAIITGAFRSDSIYFDTSKLYNSGYGNLDIFLTKYDSSGSLKWTKGIGGTLDDAGNSVTTNAVGEIFLTGYFKSTTVVIDSATTLVNNGVSNIYLAKYDTSGNAMWANSEGSTSIDMGQAVTTDAFNNIYLTGFFSNPSITFGTYPLANNGYYDVFLSKYHELPEPTFIATTELSAWLFYPNPTNGILNLVSGSSFHGATVSVYDVLGRQVLYEESSEASHIWLNCNTLQAGVYFLSVNADGKSENMRFVVNR